MYNIYTEEKKKKELENQQKEELISMILVNIIWLKVRKIKIIKITKKIIMKIIVIW